MPTATNINGKKDEEYKKAAFKVRNISTPPSLLDGRILLWGDKPPVVAKLVPASTMQAKLANVNERSRGSLKANNAKFALSP